MREPLQIRPTVRRFRTIIASRILSVFRKQKRNRGVTKRNLKKIIEVPVLTGRGLFRSYYYNIICIRCAANAVGQRVGRRCSEIIYHANRL